MRGSAPSLKLWRGFTDTAGECNWVYECVRHLVSSPALTFPLFALPLQSLTLELFSFKLLPPPPPSAWQYASDETQEDCCTNAPKMNWRSIISPTNKPRESERHSLSHTTTINKWKTNCSAQIQLHCMWGANVSLMWSDKTFNSDSGHKTPFFSCINLGVNVDDTF